MEGAMPVHIHTRNVNDHSDFAAASTARFPAVAAPCPAAAAPTFVDSPVAAVQILASRVPVAVAVAAVPTRLDASPNLAAAVPAPIGQLLPMTGSKILTLKVSPAVTNFDFS